MNRDDYQLPFQLLIFLNLIFSFVSFQLMNNSLIESLSSRRVISSQFSAKDISILYMIFI